MERRTFLASVSASIPLAVAGCLGGGDDESGETTTAPETTTTDQTTDEDSITEENSGPLSVGETASLSDDRELAVLDADASAFVVTRGTGEDRIHAVEGERYVRVKFSPTGLDDYQSFVAENVTVAVNGDLDSEDTVTLADPIFPIGGGPSRFDAAFSMPTDLTPYTATVSLEMGDESVDWEFSAGYIEAITQAVDYTVGSVSTPDTLAAGDDFTVELPVENEGDDVEFHAVLTGTANAPTQVSEPLTGGEETTIEIEATAPDTDGDSFELVVDWDYGEASTTVGYE